MFIRRLLVRQAESGVAADEAVVWRDGAAADPFQLVGDPPPQRAAGVDAFAVVPLLDQQDVADLVVAIVEADLELLRAVPKRLEKLRPAFDFVRFHASISTRGHFSRFSPSLAVIVAAESVASLRSSSRDISAFCDAFRYP